MASTHLTRLVLTNLSLPQRCGPYMFDRPGLRLRHLHELDLQGFIDPDDPRSGHYVDAYLQEADLQSIVRCCEGGCLSKLTLAGVLRGPCSFATLSPLTILTYLSLAATIADGVPELLQLRELRLNTVEVHVNTLAGISTRLTQLTALWIRQADVLGLYGSTVGDFDYNAVADGAEHDSRAEVVCLCADCWRRPALEMPLCEDLEQALREDGLWPDSSDDLFYNSSDDDSESSDCF